MSVTYSEVAHVCKQLEALGLPVTDRTVAPRLKKRISDVRPHVKQWHMAKAKAKAEQATGAADAHAGADAQAPRSEEAPPAQSDADQLARLTTRVATLEARVAHEIAALHTQFARIPIYMEGVVRYERPLTDEGQLRAERHIFDAMEKRHIVGTSAMSEQVIARSLTGSPTFLRFLIARWHHLHRKQNGTLWTNPVPVNYTPAGGWD
jgi:hypothetical protein